MSIKFDPSIHAKPPTSQTDELGTILRHLDRTMQRDRLVQSTANELRNSLQVDRVVLYYFYTQWEGRVTFESLSDEKLSIFGSTGPDLCFNNEYAALYLAGRVRAIADIENEPIEDCHRDFLRYLHVKANLVVPILTDKGLWGLLIAHHQSTRSWSDSDVELMKAGALTLASAPSINASE